MKLVMLGTGSGPRATGIRFPSSQAVVIGERIIVIDAGNGVAHQLAAAGLNPRNVSDILVTHHHVDHNADLGYLALTSWLEGRTDRISLWGPPPMADVVNPMIDAFSEDLEKRIKSTGRAPFRPMLSVNEITQQGVIFEDEAVTVTACFVDHPPFQVALGFRIDAEGSSVVISGDTAPSENLIQLAQGADILVHEVVHPSYLAGLEQATNAASIANHMKKNHTMVEDLARVASLSGVETLLMAHLIPHNLSDEQWFDALGHEYKGNVVVGRDLMEIEV